jgi:molybdenum ABC transporter molybdate-binding protein
MGLSFFAQPQWSQSAGNCNEAHGWHQIRDFKKLMKTKIKKLVLTFFAGVLSAGSVIAADANSLIVYCAAGLKKPVAAIAEKYRAETGVEVQLQYGGTGTLLADLRVARRGDLYIAADESSLADARKFDVIREVIPLVRQHPVIAVQKGNPKGIHSLANLFADDVRVALANPEAASVGKATKAALGANYAALAAHAVVTKPTVSEIANDLKLGAVDAAIVWDSTVNTFSGLEAVEVPELSVRIENASAAVLSFTGNSAATLRFARYLAAPEKGGEIFKRSGFTPIPGDKWALNQELILYSGGVNRPAVQGLLKEFADREGAEITTVFNGCGILCASMKAMAESSNPKFPDAYYACDLCFVPPVAKYFPEAVVLTETDIGLAVQKGNPHNVHTLADLAQPNLRVGICNSQQSTLGFITRGLLRSVNLETNVRKNVVVEVPTADFLINQLRAGGLDAAIVYHVNAAPQSEHLDYFPLAEAGAKALQPFSVRTDSPQHQLATRLLDFLKSKQTNFETAGFRWRNDHPIKSSEIKIPAWLIADDEKQ